jgi:hypothetical protein
LRFTLQGAAVTGAPVLFYSAGYSELGISSAFNPGDFPKGVSEGASSLRPSLLCTELPSLLILGKSDISLWKIIKPQIQKKARQIRVKILLKSG